MRVYSSEHWSSERIWRATKIRPNAPLVAVLPKTRNGVCAGSKHEIYSQVIEKITEHGIRFLHIRFPL